ncbi:hypothetical protein HZ326_20302 [Fusarium oxysporum f. sp. albedinis]|nr:hypothetical protein HZ326_20302 [Fusarium oxysporum f. sp. albedinis]
MLSQPPLTLASSIKSPIVQSPAGRLQQDPKMDGSLLGYRVANNYRLHQQPHVTACASRYPWKVLVDHLSVTSLEYRTLYFVPT